MRTSEPQGRHIARVLVVHDDVDERVELCRDLQQDPRFEVIAETGSGRSASEMAAFYQPDVVVLDLEMPWIDGAESLPLLRRAVPHARLVVRSIAATGVRAQEALALGADHIIDRRLWRSRLCDSLAELLWPPSG